MKETSYPRVRVENAPGFEDFEAGLIMLAPSADGRMMAVVGDDEGEIFAIPELYVWEV